MPKTLTALPTSQYPTDLEFVSGHALFLVAFVALATACAAIEEEGLSAMTALLLKLSGALVWLKLRVCCWDRTMVSRTRDGDERHCGCWRWHWRHTKSEGDALTASLRRPGANDAILVVVVVGGVGGVPRAHLEVEERTL